jgi:hypothetical protein
MNEAAEQTSAAPSASPAASWASTDWRQASIPRRRRPARRHIVPAPDPSGEDRFIFGHGQGGFEDLDEGDKGRRTFHLVGVSGEDLRVAAAGLGHELLGQPGLAHPGLAAHHHQRPRIPDGLIEQAAELGALDGPSHKRGALPPGGWGSWRLRLPRQGVEPPALGKPLEMQAPPVPEGELGAAAGQLTGHLGDEDFARLGPSSDAGGRVHRLTVKVVALLHHLPGVQTDPDPDSTAGRPPFLLLDRPLEGHPRRSTPCGRRRRRS